MDEKSRKNSRSRKKGFAVSSFLNKSFGTQNERTRSVVQKPLPNSVARKSTTTRPSSSAFSSPSNKQTRKLTVHQAQAETQSPSSPTPFKLLEHDAVVQQRKLTPPVNNQEISKELEITTQGQRKQTIPLSLILKKTEPQLNSQRRRSSGSGGPATDTGTGQVEKPSVRNTSQSAAREDDAINSAENKKTVEKLERDEGNSSSAPPAATLKTLAEIDEATKQIIISPLKKPKYKYLDLGTSCQNGGRCPLGKNSESNLLLSGPLMDR